LPTWRAGADARENWRASAGAGRVGRLP